MVNLRAQARRFYQSSWESWEPIGRSFRPWLWSNSRHFQSSDQLLEFFVRRLPRGSVLDAGCGPAGRDLSWLAARRRDPIGLDFVPAVLRAAHARLGRRQQLVLADLTTGLPFRNGTFSGIVCENVIQHVSGARLRDVVLPEFWRSLVPSGSLLLEFKTGSGIASRYDPALGTYRCLRLYDPDEVLRAAKRSGFSAAALPLDHEYAERLDMTNRRGMSLSAFIFDKSRFRPTQEETWNFALTDRKRAVRRRPGYIRTGRRKPNDR